MQQRVEILKALFRGAEILILDEPTSVLTPQEVEGLFDAIRALTGQGKSVIFISHKLKEVCAICDRITVLKKGKVVGTVEKKETTPDALAEMMVGREVIVALKKEHVEPGKPVLKVQGLNALNDRKLPALRDVDFEVHEYEILGLAGVEGNGQTELVEVLTGVRELRSGNILFDGKPVTHASPHERIGMGISCVPEDRQKNGLIMDFSVLENLMLGRHDRPPFATKWFRLNLSKATGFADRVIQEYSIRRRGQARLPAICRGALSRKWSWQGSSAGNLGSLLPRSRLADLMSELPSMCGEKLVEMRDQGCAVLLISADLDEIFALSDRIAVIYEGRIVAVKEAGQTNELELGLLMTGGKNVSLRKFELSSSAATRGTGSILWAGLRGAVPQVIAILAAFLVGAIVLAATGHHRSMRIAPCWQELLETVTTLGRLLRRRLR